MESPADLAAAGVTTPLELERNPRRASRAGRRRTAAAVAAAAPLGGRGRAGRPALGGAGLGRRAGRAVVQDPGRMTFDTKLGVDIDPVGLLRAAVAPVEPPGVPRQPAGPVHRLRLPDGRVLPDRAPAAHTRVGGRAAVDVAAGRGGLPGPGAAGRGSGHRNTLHPAAGGGRVRAVADVHDPDRLLLWRPAAGAAGALGRPAAGPAPEPGPPGGRARSVSWSPAWAASTRSPPSPRWCCPDCTY